MSERESATYLDDQIDITVGVGHIEDAGARQAGHAPLIEMVVQHVLNV